MKWRALIYAALAGAWLWPLLAHPFDCPFGLHDWGYACFDAQRAHLGASVLPWSEGGLGALQSRPIVEPPSLLLIALQMVSPPLGLRVMLFACALLGALATDVAAARVFGALSWPARLVAGVVYLASPFFANKLAAGHMGFIFAMPLVPALALALERLAEAGVNTPTRAFAAAAATLAAMFAQLQVGLLAVALVAAGYARRVDAGRLAVLSALALLTWAPAVYMGLVGESTGAFVREAQLHAWFVDQSIPWQHALDATWYFPHYYERFAGSWAVALWQWMSLAAVIVALATRGTPRRLAAAVVVFSAVAAGVHGPLAAVVASAFAAVPGAAVFRELFDLLVFVPFVVAGGLAIAIDAALEKTAGSVPLRSGAFAVAAAVVAATAWPVASAAVARHVPLSPVAEYDALARRAAALHGGGRVLWLPSAVPLGPRGTTGGADPFTNWFGAHATAQHYHPGGYIAYLSAVADRTPALPAFAVQATDIQAVIVRPDVVSRRLSGAAHPAGRDVTPIAPSFRSFELREPFVLYDGAPACEPPLRSALRPGNAYVRCDERDAPFEFREDAARVGDDPTRDWLDAERWAEIDPQLAAPRMPALFTLSGSTYRWSTVVPARVLVYAPQGAEIDGRPVRAAADWTALELRAGLHTARTRRGALLALTAIRPAALPQAPDAGTSGARELAPALAWKPFGAFRVTLPPHPRGFIVLRESWTPEWRAWLDGAELGPPTLADGYASGWIVGPATRKTTLVVRFLPSYTYAWLCLLAALVWIGLAVALTRRAALQHAEAPS